MASKLRSKPHEPKEDQRRAADQFLATVESSLNHSVANEERAFAPAPVPESIVTMSPSRRKLAIVIRMREELGAPQPNYRQLFFDAAELLTLYGEAHLPFFDTLQKIEMARRARLPRRSRYHKEHQECLDAIAELLREYPTLELAAIRRKMLDRYAHLNPRTVAIWVRSALNDSARN